MIRRLIREMLLQEAAYTPDDFPDGVSVELEVAGGSASKKIFVQLSGKGFNGYLRARRRENFSPPCFEAFEVKMSTAPKGFGPLLYDIAMEVASEIGGGLYADRFEVSPEARRVWSYYDTNRPDVEKFVMDSPENELTPDLHDNCDVWTAKNQLVHGEWTKDPISKVYVKKGSPTIKRSLQLGKIKITGWSPK